MLSPTIVVAAGALLSYILYTRITLYIARQRIIREHGCKPSTRRFNKDPFLGLDVIRMMSRNSAKHIMLEENQKRFEKMGTTFLTRFATRAVISTCEPENIKTILSLNFKDYDFGGRQEAFTPLLGHGIFNADGERWANSRHLLRPNFAREQIADIETFEKHFKLLLQHIPRDGQTVDLQDLFFRLTLDTATEFLFNHSSNSLRLNGANDETNDDVAFGTAFNAAQDDAAVRLRLGIFDIFRSHTAGNRAIEFTHAYVDKFVDQALQYRQKLDEEKGVPTGKNERYIFIQEVVKQTTDKKRIRDELINILLAGRDTTASLLSNMFFQLARRPELWARLRQEVESLNGRTPSYEELRNLKFVKWCLNESLRLHPVVPGNARFAIKDTVLPLGGGPDGKHALFVPKGTMVGYSVFVMHRRKDIYGPDADAYDPYRWEHLRPSWEYLPFNGGPRICLGQQYALTEASYVTVRLVQEFAKLESRDSEPWREQMTMTLSTYGGVKVALTPAAA